MKIDSPDSSPNKLLSSIHSKKHQNSYILEDSYHTIDVPVHDGGTPRN